MYVHIYVCTYVCVSCDSYNKYLLFLYSTLNDWFLKLVTGYVFCDVGTEFYM